MNQTAPAAQTPPAHHVGFEKPNLSADDWQLYTCTMPPSLQKRVAESLNKAAWQTFLAAYMKLDKMKLGTPAETIRKAIYDAYRAHLEKALYRNAKHGAADTEPRYVAARLMVKFASRYVEMTGWDF